MEGGGRSDGEGACWGLCGGWKRGREEWWQYWGESVNRKRKKMGKIENQNEGQKRKKRGKEKRRNKKRKKTGGKR